MKNKKKSKKLETISLRGEKDLWIEFVYTNKKRNAKNTWEVLSKLIKNYISEEKQGDIYIYKRGKWNQ